MKVKIIAEGQNSSSFMESLKGENSLDELIESVNAMLQKNHANTQSSENTELKSDSQVENQNNKNNNFKM
ncbi:MULTISPECIES: hypothetical protein [Vibrio harveyi group]|uniref:hypothetical protein n=1 Tax=Vibrio harveyi group TaxID=717610 RepID=UPI0015F3BB06|nr:hypothetical protein [Vibrio alginolyticus]HDM8060801.1 hypothetical protein [Vibrio harveyi]